MLQTPGFIMLVDGTVKKTLVWTNQLTKSKQRDKLAATIFSFKLAWQIKLKVLFFMRPELLSNRFITVKFYFKKNKKFFTKNRDAIILKKSPNIDIRNSNIIDSLHKPTGWLQPRSKNKTRTPFKRFDSSTFSRQFSSRIVFCGARSRAACWLCGPRFAPSGLP